MRGAPTRRRQGLALFVMVLCLGLLQAAAPAGPPARPHMSDALFSAGLEAEGTVVRRTPSAIVTRVLVRQGGSSTVLYRVRVVGRFLARALRYEVRAGDETIGYGVPTADGRAVETVTTDARVLEQPLSAAYPEPPERPAQSAPQGTATDGSSIPNPARPGPHAISKREYDLGDEVFQPSGVTWKVEIAGNVTYPTDLENGPYPIVLFLHGNHVSCYRHNEARLQWPCKDGWRTVPNHRGYRYAAERLASNGYVVVSVSANGVNFKGNRLQDSGMRQRGDLLDEHVRLWERWSSSGAQRFAGRFVDAIDMTRLGTMGHSRGGEGVVWHKVVDDERADPFGIDAVLAIAPVDFTRQTINEVPFATVLPTCDGDVFDLQGVHFFDDSRYNMPDDPGPKHTVTVIGANHNFFNEVWSSSSKYPGVMDDGEYSVCFGERMPERYQRRIGASYIVGFFRRYLQDELAIDPMWTGAATPRFTGSDEIRVSYHAPDDPAHRMDVVRFTRAADLRENHLGGEMFVNGLTRYGWCANTVRTPCLTEQYSEMDIHHPGLGQATIGWEDAAGTLGMRLPAGNRDVSGFDAFQFRAVVPPGYELNRGNRSQDLSIVMVDGAGGRAKVLASDVGNENLSVPRRHFFGHVIMNQIRFPLSTFDGVDLTDVRTIRLRFDQTQTGVIHAADVAFTGGGAVLPKGP